LPFAPGNNANPTGRPKGSRNKRTQEILDLIEQRGDKDPLDFLSSVVSTPLGFEVYSQEHRIQAANYLLPYKHSKLASTPMPRYITDPVQLPHPEPTSLEQVSANINFISVAQADGRIDLDFASSLITGYRALTGNLIAEEELKLKLANSPLAVHDTGP